MEEGVNNEDDEEKEVTFIELRWRCNTQRYYRVWKINYSVYLGYGNRGITRWHFPYWDGGRCK